MIDLNVDAPNANWEKARNIPTSCSLLTRPDVRFQDRKVTRAMLRQMMEHFGFKPSPDLTIHASRPTILAVYEKQFLPLFGRYISRLPSATPQLATPSYPSTVRPPTVLSPPDLNQSTLLIPSNPSSADVQMQVPSNTIIDQDSCIDPNAKSSTKQAVFKILSRHLKPGMVLTTMSRCELVKLYNRFISVSPSIPPPTTSPQFRHRPRAVTAQEMARGDRDMIRHAIQCYAPNVFIPLGVCNTTILLSLYAKFVCEDEDPTDQLCEGVHYHLIDPVEINLDNNLQF